MARPDDLRVLISACNNRARVSGTRRYTGNGIYLYDAVLRGEIVLEIEIPLTLLPHPPAPRPPFLPQRTPRALDQPV